MTRQWIFSIVAGTLIWEMTFGTFVWPSTGCWCRGKWAACFWCHGQGEHTRYVRQAFDAVIRKAGGS